MQPSLEIPIPTLFEMIRPEGEGKDQPALRLFSHAALG
jgi:hypothetical protein